MPEQNSTFIVRFAKKTAFSTAAVIGCTVLVIVFGFAVEGMQLQQA